MAKTPVPQFICTKCDTQLLKWSGQCPECQAWGSVKELDGAPLAPTTGATKARPGKSHAFKDLGSTGHAQHQATGFSYWDRLLSGGMVPGSVTLLGGEPGIGKSTLLAQLALTLAKQNKTVLYVTGEESPSQVYLRLKRLSPEIPEKLQFLDLTQADAIASTIAGEKPVLTIVDSIQSLRLPEVVGEAGNPTQMKASASVIHEAAKKSQSSVILVGQVTKEGELAGPRLLEHLVDTVLMIEGDRTHAFRIARVIKHRFGSTEESAVLQMTEKGLEEVPDASAALLADRPKNVSGTIVTCLIEGSRPLLVELQALVTPAGYATPSRRSSGIDTNRLNLLLAVLARRCGLGFGDQDVFANAIGGVDADQTSVDLSLVLALASAKQDFIIPPTVAAWGEVGLAGEIRPVGFSSQRLKEAARMGFERVIVPNEKQLPKIPGLEMIACGTVREALEKLR